MNVVSYYFLLVIDTAEGRDDEITESGINHHLQKVIGVDAERKKERKKALRPFTSVLNLTSSRLHGDEAGTLINLTFSTGSRCMFFTAVIL